MYARFRLSIINAMIKEAHIGVGICGVEGTAAARAGDYVISQFHFLHDLLFVHGWWSYRRVSLLVLYIFYKTTLVAMCMFLFGLFSGFSGQQFFNDVSYQLYNVLFTAAPVLVLATLDRALNRTTLQNFPITYRSIGHRKLFNGKTFSTWILRSIVHSIFIFFGVAFALGANSFIETDGKTHGLWYTSTAVYSCLNTLVTMRILYEMATITNIHHFFVWSCLIGFFPVMILISVLPKLNVDLYGVVLRLYSAPRFWFVLFITVAFPLMCELAFKFYRRRFHPEFRHILMEAQRFNPSSLLTSLPSSLSASLQRTPPPSVVHYRPPSPSKSKLQPDQQRGIVMQLRRFTNATGSNFDCSPLSHVTIRLERRTERTSIPHFQKE